VGKDNSDCERSDCELDKVKNECFDPLNIDPEIDYSKYLNPDTLENIQEYSGSKIVKRRRAKKSRGDDEERKSIPLSIGQTRITDTIEVIIKDFFDPKLNSDYFNYLYKLINLSRSATYIVDIMEILGRILNLDDEFHTIAELKNSFRGKLEDESVEMTIDGNKFNYKLYVGKTRPNICEGFIQNYTGKYDCELG
jgi:hypothetical protein